MTATLVKQLSHLPVEEKLQLIGALWDTVDESAAPLHPAQVEEVRGRMAAMRNDATLGISLDELKSKLR